MAIELYVDATCSCWQKTNGFSDGEILISFPTYSIKEKHTIVDPKLKQFINNFEFLAIRRALAILKSKRYKHFTIYSDSSTAIKWARDPRIVQIPRALNKAGWMLDKYVYGYIKT